MYVRNGYKVIIVRRLTGKEEPEELHLGEEVYLSDDSESIKDLILLVESYLVNLL